MAIRRRFKLGLKLDKIKLSKQDFDEQIVAQFPLLYADRHLSPTRTCMSFGFDTSSGWNQIIWDLSQKLEPIIAKYIRDNPNLSCATCGCDRDRHYGYKQRQSGKCLAIHKEVTKTFSWYLWSPKYKKESWRVEKQPISNSIKDWLARKVVWPVQQTVSRVLNWTLSLVFSQLYTCWCEKYKPDHPRASQVKEKLSGLRFYVTNYTDGMEEPIIAAENQASVTCEKCGHSGKTRSYHGWLVTLCEKDWKTYQAEKDKDNTRLKKLVAKRKTT